MTLTHNAFVQMRALLAALLFARLAGLCRAVHHRIKYLAEFAPNRHRTAGGREFVRGFPGFRCLGVAPQLRTECRSVLRTPPSQV